MALERYDAITLAGNDEERTRRADRAVDQLARVRAVRASCQRIPATTTIRPRVSPNQARRPSPILFPTYSPNGSTNPATTTGTHALTMSSAPPHKSTRGGRAVVISASAMAIIAKMAVTPRLSIIALRGEVTLRLTQNTRRGNPPSPRHNRGLALT